MYEAQRLCAGLTGFSFCIWLPSKTLKKCICMHICVIVCHECVSTHRGQKKVLNSPGSGVIDGWKLPDMGAGNQTQVLCKNGKYS